jgi:hypothetical protein
LAVEGLLISRQLVPRHLIELGVEHGDLVDAGYGHVLTSRDPDGIPVEFFAPVAQ